MDRYEFRAMRADGGGMVYGLIRKQRERDLSKSVSGVAYTGNWVYWIDSHEGNIGSWIIDPETIGQYTGFKDENGSMVFVGDKFNPISKNLTYVVVFKEAQFGLESELGYWGSLKRYYELAERHNWSYEVIGNIHESEVVL